MNTPTEKLDGLSEKTKKAYSKPMLQTYGDVLELTQLHGATGSPDGSTTGSGFVNKTG